MYDVFYCQVVVAQIFRLGLTSYFLLLTSYFLLLTSGIGHTNLTMQSMQMGWSDSSSMKTLAGCMSSRLFPSCLGSFLGRL